MRILLYSGIVLHSTFEALGEVRILGHGLHGDSGVLLAVATVAFDCYALLLALCLLLEERGRDSIV